MAVWSILDGWLGKIKTIIFVYGWFNICSFRLRESVYLYQKITHFSIWPSTQDQSHKSSYTQWWNMCVIQSTYMTTVFNWIKTEQKFQKLNIRNHVDTLAMYTQSWLDWGILLASGYQTYSKFESCNWLISVTMETEILYFYNLHIS